LQRAASADFTSRRVPVLLHSRYCRSDAVDRFGEHACIGGGLGPRLPATELMALANAMRLKKFGA
jgi:2,3-bisphosphoglycerate-independent phosphoglycerate mutase